MKTGTNMLPIDKEKLYRALRKQGVTPSKASREMGYGSTYLKNSADKGSIHKAAVKLLGACYGIEYGEYMKVEQIAPESKNTQKTQEAPEEDYVIIIKQLDRIEKNMVTRDNLSSIVTDIIHGILKV